MPPCILNLLRRNGQGEFRSCKIDAVMAALPSQNCHLRCEFSQPLQPFTRLSRILAPAGLLRSQR